MPKYTTFLAGAVAVVLYLAVLTSAGTADAATTEAVRADAAMERTLLTDLNRIRASRGLRPLALSPELSRAARGHATAMAQLGFFSHDSANGASFARRIACFYPAGRARSWVVGENILWQGQSAAVSDAVAAWMASPGHRANILASDFRVIGIAAVRATAAPGAFGGLDVTILVTDFGARS